MLLFNFNSTKFGTKAPENSKQTKMNNERTIIITSWDVHVVQKTSAGSLLNPAGSFKLYTFICKVSLCIYMYILLKFQLMIRSLLDGEIHQKPALTDVPEQVSQETVSNRRLY